MIRITDSKINTGEIALLFAVPLTQAGFIARVSESDWLRKFDYPDLSSAERPVHLQRVWENEYHRSVADPFNELIEVAARLGIEVRTSATLATLHEITLKRSVIILFAHWKGAEITNDDFIRPVKEQAFVERVRNSNTSLDKWLSDRFYDSGLAKANAIGRVSKRRFWPLISASRHHSTLFRILCDALHVNLFEYLGTEDGVDEVLEHEVTRTARRRDALDSLFHGLLRPGNRLELYDGLHTKEVVESAIAADFEGILDLTTCTSTVLADFIAARRQFRLRTVQFPNVQDPLWAGKCVKAAVELVAMIGLSYLEARDLAHRELKQTLHEIEQPKSLLKQLRYWSRR